MEGLDAPGAARPGDRVGAGLVVGLALPAMLSVEFLPRGTVAETWSLAGLTAGGVQARIGGSLGDFAWVMVLLCALLVIVPNTTSAADAFIRRWVEVSWTGIRALQRWDPHRIRTLTSRCWAATSW